MMSTIEDHLNMVRDLKKNPDEIQAQTTAAGLDKLHMAIGVAGESGEVVDLVKKEVFNNKTIEPAETLKECGDVLFYMAGLLDAYGWTIEDALSQNISKLRTRYPEGYSDEAAAAKRDQQ